MRKKASLEKISISNDVMLFIADKIVTNIRELEGAFIRVIAYSSLTNRSIDVSLAEEALKGIIDNKNKHKIITIEQIQKEVAEHFAVKPDELRAKKRTKNVTLPRHVAMYLARELTDASLPKIGEDFGGRDHTTIMHAHKKMTADINNDSQLKSIIEQIIVKINNC